MGACPELHLHTAAASAHCGSITMQAAVRGQGACSRPPVARSRNSLKKCVSQGSSPAVPMRRQARHGRCAAAETSTATVVSSPPTEQPAVAAAAPEQPGAPAPPQAPQPPAMVKQLRLRSAAAYLPHPDKESYGGEDAHFVSTVSGGAIGVADGVGGWAESGINPAGYSRTFMRVACAYVEGLDTRAIAAASLDGSAASSPCASLSSIDGGALGSLDGGSAGPPPGPLDPRAALDAAHKLTKVPGSATACVVQLCPEQRALIAANLGDSGFIVVRRGAIALRSSPRQHFFDCPLQFGSFPEHVDGTDTADDAEVYTLPVQPGDVIIAGSDGLWDNAYSSELLELVPASPDGVDDAADAIARLARRHASDPDWASPYTAEAKAQGLDWPWWMKLVNTKLRDGRLELGSLTGGKMDDITVLVGYVEEAEVPAAAAGSGAAAGAADAASAATVAAAGSAAGNGNGAAV